MGARSAIVGYPPPRSGNPPARESTTKDRRLTAARCRVPSPHLTSFPARRRPSPSPSRARDVPVGRNLLSQTRARLRALASLGLSIVVLGALAPSPQPRRRPPAEALVPFLPKSAPAGEIALVRTPDSVARLVATSIAETDSTGALSRRLALLAASRPVPARVTAVDPDHRTSRSPTSARAISTAPPGRTLSTARASSTGSSRMPVSAA